MANVLAVAKQHAIIVLAQLGRSQRQIAAALGIDRSTVKRYIDRERAARSRIRAPGSKPTIPITGSGDVLTDSGQAKPTISIAGSAGRQSQCWPQRGRRQRRLRPMGPATGIGLSGRPEGGGDG